MLKAKTLYLVRHAKSSWKDTSLSDLERPLNKRGTSNAPMMGGRLAELIRQEDGEFPTPQRIISSPALRALSTATVIGSVIGFEEQNITTDKRLYFQGAQGMLAVVVEQHSDVDSIMLVGHNPAITELHNQLNPVETDKLPTCAIVTLHFECEHWHETALKKGCLVNYDYPRKTLEIL